MKIECPHTDCRQRIEIGVQHYGMETACPTCNRPFICPFPDDRKSGQQSTVANAVPFLIQFYGHFYWIVALVIAIALLLKGSGIVAPAIVLGVGAVFQRMGRAFASGSKQAAYAAWVLFVFFFALPALFIGGVYVADNNPRAGELVLKTALASFGTSFFLFGLPAIVSAFYWKRFK